MVSINYDMLHRDFLPATALYLIQPGQHILSGYRHEFAVPFELVQKSKFHPDQ